MVLYEPGTLTSEKLRFFWGRVYNLTKVSQILVKVGYVHVVYGSTDIVIFVILGQPCSLHTPTDAKKHHLGCYYPLSGGIHRLSILKSFYSS